MSRKYVETFRTQEEVLRKIEELKLEGYSEQDMYAMARDKEELSLVRGRTDVDLESSEGNWMDKFKAFVTGDSPVREAFHRMGLEREAAERYYDDVNNGAILLYADSGFDQSGQTAAVETSPNYVDGNIAPPTGLEDNRTAGANFTSEPTHTEPGSDHGKNLEPSREDKQRFGNETSGSSGISNESKGMTSSTSTGEHTGRRDNNEKPRINIGSTANNNQTHDPRNNQSKGMDSATNSTISDDVVDAGTPRSDIRPDQEGGGQQEAPASSDNSEWPPDSRGKGNSGTISNSSEETIWVGNDTHIGNRHEEKQVEDENRLWGGQGVEDDKDVNSHNHETGRTKDKKDKSEEERRLLEEERVFRNKDRF
ncbi:hypothetical protein E2R51_10550 [Jeotgalibacillus sp. S-D1]|uniref:general stress protein n=1 Tax=Jeotgalibacillus sp. S-D1 TaxID=2552189 RepID=UPI00105993E7|nr:general stress protein [Jeotgalibacillus sp. S-D1]TDL33087.1 hypothetical protein E2R51_10550 [Jeotgalibacillus sp. S-D1]